MAPVARGVQNDRPSSADPAEKPARILAIDYGRRRLGLALSDELGLTAQPLATVARSNRRQDLLRLRRICRDQGVRRILVGHPLHMTGEAGEMAREASQFAARLQKELQIETELADERLSSWEAQETVAANGRKRRQRSAPLDHFAAAIFLRDYLDAGRAAGLFLARKG